MGIFSPIRRDRVKQLRGRTLVALALGARVDGFEVIALGRDLPLHRAVRTAEQTRTMRHLCGITAFIEATHRMICYTSA